MKPEDLKNAIGEIRDEYIVDAHAPSHKKKKRMIRWVAAAACAAIVCSVLPVGVIIANRRIKDRSPNDTSADTNAGAFSPSGNSNQKPDNLMHKFSAQEKPENLAAFAVYEAAYPEMVEYPTGSDLYDQKACDAWWATRNTLFKENNGAGESLDKFFSDTVKAFMTGIGDENRVYSPLNVYFAFAMLAEITRGNTRAQILTLLGTQDIASVRKQANKIWKANYCDDGAVTDILASAIWLSDDVKFREEALATLTDSYFASSYTGKMGTEEFNACLHEWLNYYTGNLLENEVSDLNFTDRDVAAITTTLYFRAKWSNEFSETYTKPSVFHAPTGDVTKEFMNQTEWYGNYYYADNFSATYLMLDDNGGIMWFILPDENVSTDELLSDTTALNFMFSDKNVANNKCIRINYSIPKFDVSSKLDLRAGMTSLGVTDCFISGKADFSSLTDVDGVYLSKAEHAARVAIDEKGVTAAAYTALAMSGAPVPPTDEIDFILDRPFIFIIESRDNLPLFVGVVNQP